VLRLGLTVGEVGREGRGVGEPAQACVCVCALEDVHVCCAWDSRWVRWAEKAGGLVNLHKRVCVRVCVRLKVCMCAALETHGG